MHRSNFQRRSPMRTYRFGGADQGPPNFDDLSEDEEYNDIYNEEHINADLNARVSDIDLDYEPIHDERLYAVVDTRLDTMTHGFETKLDTMAREFQSKIDTMELALSEKKDKSKSLKIASVYDQRSSSIEYNKVVSKMLDFFNDDKFISTHGQKISTDLSFYELENEAVFTGMLDRGEKTFEELLHGFGNYYHHLNHNDSLNKLLLTNTYTPSQLVPQIEQSKQIIDKAPQYVKGRGPRTLRERIYDHYNLNADTRASLEESCDLLGVDNQTFTHYNNMVLQEIMLRIHKAIYSDPDPNHEQLEFTYESILILLFDTINMYHGQPRDRMRLEYPALIIEYIKSGQFRHNNTDIYFSQFIADNS